MPYGENSNMSQFHLQQQQHPPHQHQQHRKENGQIGGLLPQMPNICGDLPTLIPPPEHGDHQVHQEQQQIAPGSSGSGNDPAYGLHSQNPRGTLKRNKNISQPQNSYEMTMPDAILAAAMMNIHQQNFSPHNHPSSNGQHGSPNEFSHGTLRAVRRSSLTFKDQIGHYGESCSHEGNGSRTMPRPPKRTTPSVKFSCSDPINSGEGSLSSTSASVCGGDQPQFKSPQASTQTLKPSLKKSSNYAPAATDELKV